MVATGLQCRPGVLRHGEGSFGAETGNPGAGAAERVCRNEKAQGFYLRENRCSRCAVLRPLADQLALAIHHDINL
jgi:hypothetical protein